MGKSEFILQFQWSEKSAFSDKLWLLILWKAFALVLLSQPGSRSINLQHFYCIKLYQHKYFYYFYVYLALPIFCFIDFFTSSPYLQGLNFGLVNKNFYSLSHLNSLKTKQNSTIDFSNISIHMLFHCNSLQ